MAISTDPLTLYGLKVSYYTGKMEGYLRYKEIPYDFVYATPKIWRRMRERTGAAQVPAIELPDGRWMTDTTPMIEWFEHECPEPVVIPHDPLQGFFSRLLEDYAEEWLWRPAMHFRWSYPGDAALLSRRIVDQMMPDIRVPGALKRKFIRHRQQGGWAKGDGVTEETWDHVERCYFTALDQLSAMFATRPFVLGDVPSLADFGFFASMFRHFGQDPTAVEIMRTRAPAVFEWQARLWNARGSEMTGGFVDGVPDDWDPVLDEIGSAYLPYLNANARGWLADEEFHDAEIQGVQYRELPVSQYRVWCLERLRRHFEALPDAVRAQARQRLEAHGCWHPLWQIEEPRSRYPADGIPFRGVKVHHHADRGLRRKR